MHVQQDRGCCVGIDVVMIVRSDLGTYSPCNGIRGIYV